MTFVAIGVLRVKDDFILAEIRCKFGMFLFLFFQIVPM